jgi:hypothetical protein
MVQSALAAESAGSFVSSRTLRLLAARGETQFWGVTATQVRAVAVSVLEPMASEADFDSGQAAMWTLHPAQGDGMQLAPADDPLGAAIRRVDHRSRQVEAALMRCPLGASNTASPLLRLLRCA